MVRWTLLVILLCSPGVYAQILNRWNFIMVGKPNDYQNGVGRPDPETTHNGAPSIYIRSRIALPEEEGTFIQTIDADPYRGKRIRFHAFVKSENVSTWAGLWMRIIFDPSTGSAIETDNMENRPIRGTTDWNEYAVVLNVAPMAARVAYGITLHGAGNIWLSEAKVEVVGQEIPTTGGTK